MFGLKFGGKEDFMNEYDAAMMKLASFYELARYGEEEHMLALIADSVTKMRLAGKGKLVQQFHVLFLKRLGFD